MMDNAIRTQDLANYDSASLLTGFFIGALVGFGAMLLLAPGSGRQTRDEIRQKSTEITTRTVDTFDELVALSHFDNRQILAGTHGKTKDS